LRRKNPKPRFAAGPGLTPHTDALLSYEELAQRWNLTVFVAKRTAKKFGLPIIRLSSQAARVRLSDVLKAEQEAVITIPVGFRQISLAGSSASKLKKRRPRSERRTIANFGFVPVPRCPAAG
jgi:hypothetical protein